MDLEQLRQFVNEALKSQTAEAIAAAAGDMTGNTVRNFASGKVANPRRSQRLALESWAQQKAGGVRAPIGTGQRSIEVREPRTSTGYGTRGRVRTGNDTAGGESDEYWAGVNYAALAMSETVTRLLREMAEARHTAEVPPSPVSTRSEQLADVPRDQLVKVVEERVNAATPTRKGTKKTPRRRAVNE